MRRDVCESGIHDILEMLAQFTDRLKRGRDWKRAAKNHGVPSPEATGLAKEAAMRVVLIPSPDSPTLRAILKEGSAARACYDELVAADKAFQSTLVNGSRTEAELERTLAGLEQMPCDSYVQPGAKKKTKAQVAESTREQIGAITERLRTPPDPKTVTRLERAVRAMGRATAALQGRPRAEGGGGEKARPSVNDPRDHWIYEQYVNGIKVAKICQELKQKAKEHRWALIENPAGITLAMKRAAVRWGIPRPVHAQRRDDRELRRRAKERPVNVNGR